MATNLHLACIIFPFLVLGSLFCRAPIFLQPSTDTPSSSDLSGSLGSRLNELKQKVVAENPQEYGVAVPRK